MEERPLSDAELAKAVDYVGGNIAANAESIRTWIADFEMTVRRTSSVGFRVATPPADRKTKLKSPYTAIQAPFYITMSVKGHFDYDRKNNRVSSSRQVIGPIKYENKQTGDVYDVDYPEDEKDQKYILVDQEFFQLDPRTAVRRTPDIPVGTAANSTGSREIVRDERKAGEKRSRYGDVFDPKHLLGHDRRASGN